MTASRVAVLRTSPRSVLADYHELMNLAGYREVIAPEAAGERPRDPTQDGLGWNTGLVCGPVFDI